jgi:polyisoprenoid-binding protein YceI
MEATMKRAINLLSIAILVIAFGANSVQAKEYTFDVESKFVNITFESQMDVEDILGTTHTISGTASFDGKAGGFNVSVPVASLDTGIKMRDEHLQGEMWMDAAKAPNIVFKGDKVVEKSKGKYEVSGNLSFRGVTKAATISVTAKEIPAETAKKFGLGDAGALRIRSKFSVKLSDYGIQIPEMAAAKVSDVWTVNISVFAKGK